MNDEMREAVLQRDGHQCQLDRWFGITELTGIPCSEDLEAHHKTYARCGHEEEGDLIIVCHRCHEFLTDGIRRERERKELKPDDIQRVLPERSDIKDAIRDYNVPDYGDCTARYAQRCIE